jgi:hypothetical protein
MRSIKMAWFRGKDVDVFIMTENDAYGISQSSETVAAQAWVTDSSLLSDFIVGPLKTDSVWVGTETDATGSFPVRAVAIPAVEGIDLTVDAEREDADLLGRIVQDKINLRGIFDVTIVKKASNADWALLFNGADAGLTGTGASTALNPADDETEPESGFRVVVKLSNGGEDLWFTGRNCTYVSYTPTTPAVKTVTEALVFHSNLFDATTQSVIAATTEAEL